MTCEEYDKLTSEQKLEIDNDAFRRFTRILSSENAALSSEVKLLRSQNEVFVRMHRKVFLAGLCVPCVIWIVWKLAGWVASLIKMTI